MLRWWPRAVADGLSRKAPLSGILLSVSKPVVLMIPSRGRRRGRFMVGRLEDRREPCIALP